MKRGYRYRIYPTREQRELIARSCGVARLIYNVSLEQRSLAYRLGARSISGAAQDAEWVKLKRQAGYEWLGEVHSDVIGQALRDLDGAFKRFFAGQAAHPRHHRRGERDSFRLCQRRIRGYLSIEVRKLSSRWGEVKLPKLGWVRVRLSRPLLGEIRHVTVMRTALGWEMSLCTEDGRPAAAQRTAGPAVGIDAGVAVSFATSDGDLNRVPRPSPSEERRRLCLERRLARQSEGSRRRERTKRQLGRLRATDARRRQDYLHKLTASLVRRNSLIAVEDLRVKDMTRSACGTVAHPGRNVAQKAGLNRAILAQGWGEFRRQLRYKSEEHGVTLIAVPPRHTSVRCRICGHTANENRESQAVFSCAACRHTEHADIHAAKNILEAAIHYQLQQHPADGLAVAARGALSEMAVKREPSTPAQREERIPGPPGRKSSFTVRPDLDHVDELRELPVELIDRNPAQPRRRFDPARLTALAESLETTGGVLQPITVRPHGSRYQLIAGERRWRASLIAGRPTVRAIVRDAEDTAVFELAAIENMVRDDLTPVEEARCVAALCDIHGLSKAEIGRRVGRTREAISNLVRLLELPDEVLELIDNGRLTEGHGRAVLMCPDHGDRRRLARLAAAGGWSVRRLERQARGDRPGSTRREAHPDQLAFGRALGDALQNALGRDVEVAPSPNGYRVILQVGDPDDAGELLARVGAPALSF